MCESAASFDELLSYSGAEAATRKKMASEPYTQMRVTATALECGLSAYDAEFVVLARMLGVPLVTLDKAMLDGAGDVAVPLP